MRHIARSFAAADATSGGDPVISIDGVDATNVSPRASDPPELYPCGLAYFGIALGKSPNSRV